jgi:hypothetical protein
VIEALPQQRNMVIVQNAARTQQYQGVVWFGELRRPFLTVIRTNQGEKPVTVEGHDLLLHEGNFAAYGDKKLLRYTIDSEIDPSNRLLFFGLFPGWAEGNLARWLVRKSGDNFTNAGILKIARHLQSNPDSLQGWCQRHDDLFQKKNHGYLIYAEPSLETLRKILKVAIQK